MPDTPGDARFDPSSPAAGTAADAAASAGWESTSDSPARDETQDDSQDTAQNDAQDDSGRDDTDDTTDLAVRPLPPTGDESPLGVVTADRTAAGVRWSFIALLVRQVGRLGFALLIARLLGPEDFGIASEATIYIALMALILDSGFGVALIHRQNIDRRDEGAVFVWSMIAAGGLAVVTLFAAPWVADLLNTPELTAMLRVLAVGVIFKAFSVVPGSMLNRALRFKELAIAEIVATLLAAAAGIVAAAIGTGYWALVIQQLAADFLFTVILVAYAGFPGIRTTRAAFVGVRRMGAQVLGSQVLSYLTRNLDTMVIAKFLGAVPLAFYMVAYRIMLVPVALLGSIANRVGLPVFARLQHDLPEMRRYFLRITETIAVVVVPAMLVLAALAPAVIQVLFGPQWVDATLPMQVLALTGIMQTLVTAGGAIFMAHGRSDLALRWAIIPLIVSGASFFAGLPWGINGVSIAYTIATYLLAPFMLQAIGRLIEMTARQWFGAVLPAVVCGTASAAVAFAVRLIAESQELASIWVLLAGGAAAVVVYFAVLRLAWPATLRRTWRAAKRIGTPSGRAQSMAA